MADGSRNGTDPGDGLTAFERFERLTKQVLSVPKAEVDALKKKQKAKREKRSATR